MNQLKVSTRLALLVGFLAVLLAAIGAAGLIGIGLSNRALESVYADRTVPLGQLGEIESRLLSNRLAISTALLDDTPEARAGAVTTVETNIEAINGL